MTGCASQSPVKVVESELPGASALKELRDISIEARDELRILAKIRESKSQASLTPEQHNQKFFQATYVPDGFEKRVDFKYTGEASKATEAIAMIAGYKMKVFGVPIPNEPWVGIEFKDKPINEALKEVGMQTGDAIRIEVYAPAKLIRFIYKEQ